MKRSTATAARAACLTLLLTFFSLATSVSQGPGVATRDYEGLARRIVSASVNIKPGDVVVIYGGKHNIPLMEALAIEAQKAGGMVEMMLASDRVTRSYNVDVPEQYLEQKPAYWAEWIKHVDVYIGLPAFEDPKAVSAGVPEARYAKAAQASQFLGDVLNAAKFRGVFVGYPSKEEAANVKLDFPTLEKMHWEAVNADYAQVAARGAELKSILQGARVVRVSAPTGTDFSFAVGNRPILVNDGVVTPEDAQSKLFLTRMASLPGGQVSLAPIETSANGKVVVPKDTCRFAPLTGVSFEFKNGKMENFKAAQGGQCFAETIAPYTGPKDVFGGISIGLNPALKVIEEGGDYRPADAAGMVSILVGNNDYLGGNNKEPGGFGFPITNATVTVDGKIVVKDGRLAL